MKRILSLSVVLPILLFPALAAAEVVPHALPATGAVQHVVIIWLKDHGDPAARAQYIEATRELAKLPMVQSYHIGAVLSGEGREVVDKSYDVAIVATFENAAALDAYQNHAEHDRIVQEKLKPLVDKVVVYDFVESR